jgi:hypothetical protein
MTDTLPPLPACQAQECQELRRWKSTNAPRLEALEGLLRNAQISAAAGIEARKTLASERAANVFLTDENEALRAALAAVPQPAPAKPDPIYIASDGTFYPIPRKRQPLSDEQIMDIVDKERARVLMNEAKVAYRVARAIEAAHGIGPAKGEKL